MMVTPGGYCDRDGQSHLEVLDGRHVQRMIVEVAEMRDTDPVTCLSQNWPV